jgi:hypothetical protein
LLRFELGGVIGVFSIGQGWSSVRAKCVFERETVDHLRVRPSLRRPHLSQEFGRRPRQRGDDIRSFRLEADDIVVIRHARASLSLWSGVTEVRSNTC